MTGAPGPAVAADASRSDGRHVLTDRAIRGAVVTPIAVVGATVWATDEVRDPVVLLLALAVVGALVLAVLTPATLAALERDDPPRLPLLVGLVGVGLTSVGLTAGLGTDPLGFTLVFGLIIVAAAFVLPPGHREVLVGCAVLGWMATLWFGGVRDLAGWVTQTGGALLLAVVALRTTLSLEAALQVERRASDSSRTRASLLGSVLRMRSLEPATVAETVVEGVRDAGFERAILRIVEGDELQVLAARAGRGRPIAERLGASSGIAAEARRSGRTVVVDDYSRHEAALPEAAGLRGAVAVPVVVDGEVVGVLTAGRRRKGLTREQVDAVELLADEAGAALRRARRYEADAATVEQLRRLDAQTYDFVSTVSHELRTPMTVIGGLGGTLAQRWDDLPSDRRADLARRIVANADRLAEMLGSLVDTSAFERGELAVSEGPVDLRRCVAAVVERLAPLLESHRPAVDVPSDLTVVADASLLEHVVENLLVNAAQHTPPGTSVAITAHRAGGQVRVEVADDGPGIAEDDLPHVLERFYRAGEPATRPSGGLGLGLALSQQVLRAHGSELQVASRPGVGTRFSFELPFVSAR